MKSNFLPHQMPTIPLSRLVQLQTQQTSDAAFAIIRDKSTFIQVTESTDFFDQQNTIWASSTPLCGDGADQYHLYFVMSVLSATPYSDQLETLNQILVPKVLFITAPDIRRSMTLNAMRMSTELFALGSERVFQLAQQRLEAKQTDVVHDLLVYLMHEILDARRDYAQEKALRADSIAAYLGISPIKVLSLLQQFNDPILLSENIETGVAGKLHRELNVVELVTNQLELLFPHQQRAYEKETLVINVIRKILELWQDC